jgi:signal transduction histidine kinase
LIFSILLLKGVLREVEQREKIEGLAEQLRIANAGQVNLMHIMNHQIKGRLGNMRNIFAELMTDDYGVVPPEAKPLLEKGLDEAELGVNYVQGVLKGMSAETGKLPYEMKTMDFKDMVTKVVDAHKEKAAKKGLTMDTDYVPGSYTIVGDATQLSEAIKNLVDNAIAYSPSGKVEVHLFRKANTITFTVKDTGVGISEEDKKNLFKAGGRGKDSIKINVNSTGYGLAFVKGVVEAHKGKVWADSEGAGKGSTFTVEIPVA